MRTDAPLRALSAPHLAAVRLQRDYDGRTALHIAAAEGQFEAARLLLERGADPKRRDRFGSTPADDARRTRRNELILLLANWANAAAASTPSPPVTPRLR